MMRVLLIGANGGFGTLFASKLSGEGTRLAGIDLHAQSAQKELVTEYHASDISKFDDETRRLVKRAQCIILSVPDSVAQGAVRPIISAMAPGALLFDLLSVKTQITAAMETDRDDIELMSIHPMFAPNLDFAGQNVVVVQVKDGPRAQYVRSLLAKWKANVCQMTAEEHDRRAAMTQVATHAAILAFGLTLKELGYRIDKTENSTTPSHRVLLALLARMGQSDPEIYWKILQKNPSSPEALSVMRKVLGRLDDTVKEDSQENFFDLLGEIRQMLEPQLETLSRRCMDIFSRDATQRTKG